MIDEKRLSELEELLGKATQGECWIGSGEENDNYHGPDNLLYRTPDGDICVLMRTNVNFDFEVDLKLVCESRKVLPDLIAELRRLRSDQTTRRALELQVEALRIQVDTADCRKCPADNNCPGGSVCCSEYIREACEAQARAEGESKDNKEAMTE
jgi:hypothetical protein